MADKTLSDRIRQFTFERHIRPARNLGQREVTIRTGDIHKEMRLENQMPAVCGALGTKKFEKTYNVKQIRRDGPTNNSNVFFTFEIL